MIAKLKFILFVSILLASSAAAAAQKTTEKPQIKLRGKGQRIILTSVGLRRTLNVQEQISAARLDEVNLLLVTRRQSFTYLLVNACGPSKAIPDARRCGAAEECSLLWIKLDTAWKISDIKSARYESCMESSTSSDGYKISGQKLRMEYDDFTERKHYKLSYDAEQPEQGFTLEASPLEDRATN
ncbi:MAG TPA: hypothetical protein VGC66_17840 [Pyrinomonadaceae bacterium]|jgi:hypothetical protein